MQIRSIINQTALIFAEGAAYGAAYGALINPVMGVGAGAVLGAVARSTQFLASNTVFFVDRIASSKLDERLTPRAEEAIKKELSSQKLSAMLIVKISFIFACVLVLPVGMILSSYAGLYAGKYALAALGFKATIAPSLSLAAKFFLATLACNLGVILAISSVKALWNRTFSRASQGREAVV